MNEHANRIAEALEKHGRAVAELHRALARAG